MTARAMSNSATPATRPADDCTPGPSGRGQPGTSSGGPPKLAGTCSVGPDGGGGIVGVPLPTVIVGRNLHDSRQPASSTLGAGACRRNLTQRFPSAGAYPEPLTPLPPSPMRGRGGNPCLSSPIARALREVGLGGATRRTVISPRPRMGEGPGVRAACCTTYRDMSSTVIGASATEAAHERTARCGTRRRAACRAPRRPATRASPCPSL